jgi:hypothetical protein
MSRIYLLYLLLDRYKALYMAPRKLQTIFMLQWPPPQIILLAINLSTFHFSQGLQIMDFERFKGYREMSGILIYRYLGQRRMSAGE